MSPGPGAFADGHQLSAISMFAESLPPGLRVVTGSAADGGSETFVNHGRSDFLIDGFAGTDVLDQHLIGVPFIHHGQHARLEAGKFQFAAPDIKQIPFFSPPALKQRSGSATQMPPDGANRKIGIRPSRQGRIPAENHGGKFSA